MATVQSYLVIHQGGVVIDDAGASSHYPHGTTFSGHPNNPSVLRALAARRIIAATGQAQSAAAVSGGSVMGPPGPPGPPGDTVASLFSCKVRTTNNARVIHLQDTGALEPVRFGVYGEELYDPADMFNPAVGGDRIIVKPGASGRYRADAYASFTYAARGSRYAEIVLYGPANNVKDRFPVTGPPIPGAETTLALGSAFEAVAGDYFRLEIRQSSGETVRVGASLAVTYVGSPTAPSNGQRIAATNEWLTAKARLAQLPPPTNPDAYALVRARLTAEVAAALTRAESLGGLA